MRSSKIYFCSLIVVLCFPLGCSSSQPETLDEPWTHQEPDVAKDQAQDPLVGESVPGICSALDFNGVTWPESYSLEDQRAFSLAMNITGSFEGHSGWTNLSNNFDGQGFSMGILNQNLGQGTIQPLLIEMRERHLSVLQQFMTTDMLSSLLDMLKTWEEAQPAVGVLAFHQELPGLRSLAVSEASQDRDKKYVFEGFQSRSNSASVRWARNTLYSDARARRFKPEWREALKQIAGHPAYVSLQIRAAQYLYEQAHEHRTRLGWQELRSYLYLFDFVVQNGGLKEKHFEKFDEWRRANPQASEEEEMLAMLEIRVVDSLPRWQEDVRRRKTAIILGEGFVHGENRNLPVEYCYDPFINY